MLINFPFMHFLKSSFINRSNILSSKSCDISLRCFKHFITKQDFPNFIHIYPNVRDAIKLRKPVVALESTIITHGLPYPLNLQTALEVESLIEEKGALPVTIGIINGTVHVGLSKEQIEFLSKPESKCVKVSRRDFPYVIAKQLNGGTTVSGTMIVANLVDIPIFVTGGIGGVHRWGQSSMDVSADLTELGRTPITVISAGVKSILDVGRTLEFLETQGVCVMTLGESKSFPDFFTRNSGFEAPYHVETSTEAAQVLKQRRELALDSGMLIAVPIPRDQEADGKLIKQAIDQALAESEKACVKGRDVTPFVLKRVAEITEGKSVLTNIDLLKNNAKHGAEIAVQFSKLVGVMSNAERFLDTLREVVEHEQEQQQKQPVVIGGSIVDLTVKILENEIKMNGGTHLGKLTQSFGGVGRNLADAMVRLGLHPLFISAVGTDAPAESLLTSNPKLNLKGILRDKKSQTASYSILLDAKGEAMFGVGDMEIHGLISSQWVQKFKKEIEESLIVVLDGNISLETMETVFKICSQKHIPTWYEPTDVKKSIKPWTILKVNSPSFISPNINEFNAIIKHLSQGKFKEINIPENDDDITYLKLVLKASKLYLRELTAIILTLGEKGFVIIRWCSAGKEDVPLSLDYYSNKNSDGHILAGLYFRVPRPQTIASVSGAGDCLAAGFLAGMSRGKRVSECAFIGVSSASCSLESSEAVPQSLDLVTISSHQRLPYKLIT